MRTGTPWHDVFECVSKFNVRQLFSSASRFVFKRSYYPLCGIMHIKEPLLLIVSFLAI